MGKVTGMGIPEGITVIVGGGYHGKSTLLKALEQGVYNHICGDGREYVVADNSGMKHQRRTEEMCCTQTYLCLSITFQQVRTLQIFPQKMPVEVLLRRRILSRQLRRSRSLLLDEDTSATNSMIRDKVMARLVSDEKEPITTLLRHIRGIYRTLGISFVIVVGSSGDYLSVADFVLQMDHYKVKDVTKEAKSICEECGIAKQYPENENSPGIFPQIKTGKAGQTENKINGNRYRSD